MGQIVARFSSYPRVDAIKVITGLNESHAELMNSVCPLCKLFASIKPPDLDPRECCLIAFSSGIVSDKRVMLRKEFANGFDEHPRLALPAGDPVRRNSLCVYLSTCVAGEPFSTNRVEARGFLALVDSNTDESTYEVGPRVLSPDTIDFSLVREWAGHCSSNHKDTCEKATSEPVLGRRLIIAGMAAWWNFQTKASTMLRYHMFGPRHQAIPRKWILFWDKSSL